jgi:hypothetical protein
LAFAIPPRIVIVTATTCHRNGLINVAPWSGE